MFLKFFAHLALEEIIIFMPARAVFFFARREAEK